MTLQNYGGGVTGVLRTCYNGVTLAPSASARKKAARNERLREKRRNFATANEYDYTYYNMRDILTVGIGCAVGGCLRYAVSKWMAGCTALAFPWGTFTVNILGCFIIGMLSGTDTPARWLSPQVKLLLTTGFCGGFTTFSTFINESSTLVNSGKGPTALLYMAASMAVGFAAVTAGYLLAKHW